MDSTRNRIIELSDFLNSNDIEVNIGKNKARGNKGFFKSNGKSYRIDVAKNQSDGEIISVLVHEFMHYLHYKYDKTLKSLNFIFGDNFHYYEEDLIKITVDSIKKKTIEPLFNKKNCCKEEIKTYTNLLMQKYPDFQAGKPFKKIEKELNKTDYKHLLKYDRVRVYTGFSEKLYSIKILEEGNFCDENVIIYLKLKSAQRHLKRINSRISRLNRYYNALGELLARSFEYYVTKPEVMKELTPDLFVYYDNLVKENKIEILSDMINIAKSR